MRTTITMAGVLALMLASGTAGFASPGDRGARMDFGAMDLNADGQVTAEEIEGLRGARFAEIDTDGDGTITREEFTAHASLRAGERAGEMFDRLDADGDGVLGPDAMQAQLGRGPNAERMIRRFDSDGNGAISEAEFDAARAEMRQRFGGFGGHGPRN